LVQEFKRLRFKVADYNNYGRAVLNFELLNLELS